MTRLNINLKILSGFFIAFACVGYFFLITYRNAQISNIDNEETSYQLQMLNGAEEILDDVQDIETGYRGFMITNDDKYLEPCTNALERSGRDLEDYKKLTAFDPAKLMTVQSLVELVNQKKNFAEKIISLCRSGNQKEALDLVNTGDGKRIMDNIRTIIARIKADGFRKLSQKSESTSNLNEKTRNNFLILAILIFIVLSVFYAIIISDLRKGERTKKELRSAVQRANDLFNHSPSAYLIVDPGLKIIKANRAALKWLDYPEEELCGIKLLSDIVSRQSAVSLAKLLENENISNLEIELEGRKQSRSVILEGVTQRDQFGNISEKWVMLTDISERKKAEEENRYLASLIDQTSDAIFSSDKGFMIKSWNKGAENMYGFNAEEAINKNAKILKSTLTYEERKNIIQDLETKGFWHGEILHHKKDGTPVPVYSSVTAVRDESGKVTGYVSVVQDITTQKLYAEQLKNFNRELIEKVSEKTEEVFDTLERVTDGFLSLDSGFRITYVNEIGTKILNSSKQELIGKDIRTQFMKEDNDLRRAYVKAYETQEKVETEGFYPYFNSWYYVVIYPSKDGLSLFFRDITQRKEAEIKLHESENQYRKLFENNPLPMWVLDVKESTILDVNNAALKHYGYSKDEFIGMNVYNLRPEEERKRFSEYTALPKAEAENAGVWKHLKKDGSIIQVEILSYNISYNNKECRLIISNDITDKLLYEEELKSSRDQLRQLSFHDEEVREKERAFIAREIHDELGQLLTGLKMDISWLSKRIKDEPVGAREKISGMIDLVDETVKSVRKIASQLRPGIIDDLGLTAALDWQSHEFRKRTGIDCVFHSDTIDKALDKNISIGIFRIMQEALTNVARHAEATKVNCFLSITGERIKLSIGDNGKGIDDGSTSKGTLGLLGMKERAYMMNGRLDIRPDPSGGTKIELIVPLKQLVN